MYLGSGYTLCILAIAMIVVSVVHPGLSLEKVAALIPAIFGTIPMPLALIARTRRAALMLPKDEWEEAEAKNDGSAIKELKKEFKRIQGNEIDRSWFPTR
jgi:hypothetical protein